MLFGIPEHKDATGTAPWTPAGSSIRDHRRGGRGRDALTVMSDLCLDEFTDHGHCGVLTPDGRVDNDRTLAAYALMALAQADAGVDMVGPSGMMDGQVAVIRAALTPPGTPTPRSWPTPRSTPPRSTVLPRGGRSTRRATGGPTSRTSPTPARASVRPCSTSSRAPTS